MSLSTTCSTCRQLVAVDARGIAPHTRYGKPCPGGRAAPVMRPVVDRVIDTTRTPEERLAERAAKQAALNKRKNAKSKRARALATAAKRRARHRAILAVLPATTSDVAAVLGLTLTGARLALERAGCVREMVRIATVRGVSRGRVSLWRMP